MRGFKKRIACLLSFLTLVGGLGACGGNGDGVYTIDYYFIQSGTLTPQDLGLVEDAMNEILVERIEAKVKLHPIAAWSYDEKLNLIINSGDKFDICYTSSWTNNYKEKVGKEGYLDITELLPEYAPTLYANIDSELYEAIKIDGKIYGAINLQVLPRTPGIAVEKQTWEEFCTKTGFSKEDVKSLKDIEPYLAYVKEKYPDAYNIYAPPDPAGLLVEGGYDDIFGMTYPGAISVADDPSDGLTVVNQFAESFYKESFKTCVEFYKKGYISENVLTNSFDYTKGYCWNLSTWKPGADGEQSITAGREMVTFPIGESVMYNSWMASNINAISATSENPVKSLQFLELLNTDKELYNLLAFGIEGKHYTKIGENRVEVVADTKYTMGTVGWQFSNQFNSYLVTGQEDDVWEQTKTLNESAKVSPLIGFNFDSTSVELELTNCYQAYLEYINSFIYGIFEDDFDKQYNKFLNKLQIAGSDKIIAEMQKQVDAWLASK